MSDGDSKIVAKERNKLEASDFKIRRWQRQVRFWTGQSAGIVGMTVSILEFLQPSLLAVDIPPEWRLPILGASATLVFGRELVTNLIDYALFLRRRDSDDHRLRDP